MVRAQWIGFLLASAATFLTLAEYSLISAGKKRLTSADKVKATATASKPGPDGTQMISITLQIDKGWYIYANPVQAKDYESNRTDVSIVTKGAAGNFRYPEGKIKVEEIVLQARSIKLEYRIYEGQVMIQGQVRRAPGDTNPLQISIDVNACNKNSCLERSTVAVMIP